MRIVKIITLTIMRMRTLVKVTTASDRIIDMFDAEKLFR